MNAPNAQISLRIMKSQAALIWKRAISKHYKRHTNINGATLRRKNATY